MIANTDFDFEAAIARCETVEQTIRSAAFRPIERLKTSEWADRYLWLSPEDNGELTKYDSSQAPWQRAIMDSLGDIRVNRVVGMLAAQVGGKTTIMKADLAARIHQAPSPILWAIPRDKDIRTWSKERVDPLLRDTKVLRGLVTEGTREKANTIAWKGFPAGYLAIVGMSQPADLAARPVPVVRIDEYDRAPREAGAEGKPLLLLLRRMSKFSRRSLGIFSTPTTTGDSPISDEYETTDQRKWFMPCPRCDHLQVLMWGSRDVEWGLKWVKDQPDTAVYVCESCSGTIHEKSKRDMNAHAKWVATVPERTTEHGYWLNALPAMFDGQRWAELIRMFLRTKGDPLSLKVFVNTVLTETFDDRTDRLKVDKLLDRLERYAAQVPHGVAVLTRAVDVQDDRLEMAVWGFGADRESWPIDYVYLPGDPAKPQVWRDLEELRTTRFYSHESGRTMRPIVTFIDSLGHHTTHVHAHARRHKNDPEPVFAISGDGDEGHPLLSEPKLHKTAKITTYRIGTWKAKYDILHRLGEIDRPPEGQREPGYIHLPDAPWFDEERLRQLAHSERLVDKIVKGKLKRTWEVTGRNEYLDLAVYCLAALYTLGTKTVYEGLAAMAAAVSEPYEPAEVPMSQSGSRRRILSSGIAV